MFCDKGNYYLHFRLLGFQQCQNWCSQGGSDQNSCLLDSIHCLILKKRKQHFGKSICSCFQMKGWQDTYSARSEKKSYSQPLNQWLRRALNVRTNLASAPHPFTWGWKNTQFPKSCISFLNMRKWKSSESMWS